MLVTAAGSGKLFVSHCDRELTNPEACYLRREHSQNARCAGLRQAEGVLQW